jgi:glycerate 2-kinase
VNILVAPNAMKGSLDPFEAARAIAEGLARSLPDARVERLAIADGGDATAAVLVDALGGTFVDAAALDPLGRSRGARFGLVDDGAEAVVEVAASSGLALLASAELNPLTASSYGAGQLVRAALDRGCRRIVIALGGSATVDGGTGLLEALGVRFLDAGGAPISPGGGGLVSLASIDVSGLDPRLDDVDVVAACDVDNPLLGKDGAARTFGPQKGATPEMVDHLEAGLRRMAEVIGRDFGRDVGGAKHGAAAGGIAASLAGILGARLEPGADLVLNRLDIRRRLAGKEIAITAEGRIDRQTLSDKAPYALARAARSLGIPVVVMAGGVSDEGDVSGFDRFDVVVPICSGPMSLEAAMARAREHLVAAAERVGRLLSLGASLTTRVGPP